ncbi:MAG: hypothetical protein ACREXP_07825 [Steroidobacteraceae bacterium]
MRTASFLATLVVATTFAAPAPADETDEARTDDPRANDVRSFVLGEFSALALRDGTISVPNDNKVFGVGRTPAEVAALLTEAGLPTDRLELSLQPLLVKTAERVMLFDTGAGANMGPSAGKLPASLETAGVAPATITDIFISTTDLRLSLPVPGHRQGQRQRGSVALDCEAGPLLAVRM